MEKSSGSEKIDCPFRPDGATDGAAVGANDGLCPGAKVPKSPVATMMTIVGLEN